MKPKIDFQDGGHGGYLGLSQGLFATFDLQVNLILNSYKVSGQLALAGVYESFKANC